MNTQTLIVDAHLTHVRELKTALAKARQECQALRDENAELHAHLDLAILAAEDLRTLPTDGKLVIIDGWNMILGSPKVAKDREDLHAQAAQHIAEHPQDFVWLVFDGPHPSSTLDGRIRVSYTGGAGAHRADKFICDFLKMARFRGDLARIEVRTNDKDFRKEIKRIRKL